MTSVGSYATLACLWEVTAAKPGNVYRGADFEDLTYVDFLTSATLLGKVIDQSQRESVGQTVLDAVEAIHSAVGTNSHLGTLLLLVPLAKVPRQESLAAGIEKFLLALDSQETGLIYQAIRLAQPGGLGQVDTEDVYRTEVPKLALVEAMQLAADRDLVARQYTNGFAQVFETADRMEQHLDEGHAMGDAIVRSYLQLLAEHPDTLIARKCGKAMAREAADRAAEALRGGPIGAPDYRDALAELDFWLRADGHRRNPGTSADLIAAALFVILREDRLDWPVRFYPPIEERPQ